MANTLHVAISASHNIDERVQSVVDDDLREAERKYRESGRQATTILTRVRHSDPRGYDENKYNMSLATVDNSLRYLTTLTMSLIRLGIRDTHVAAIGCKDSSRHKSTQTLVRLVSDYLHDDWGKPKDQFIFGDEGRVPKLSRNLKNGKELLGSPEKYVYLAGDIPHVDLDSLAIEMDQFDPELYDIGINFNRPGNCWAGAKPFVKRTPYQYVFENKEYDDVFEEVRKHHFGPLFHLNILLSRDARFQKLLSELDGSGEGVKEDNLYKIGHGFRSWAFADVAHESRKSGGLNKAIIYLNALRHRSFHNAMDGVPLLDFILHTKAFSYWKSRDMIAFTPKSLEVAGRVLLGERGKIQADHHDPWRMFDLDGWEDLALHQGMLDTLANNHPNNSTHGLDFIYEQREAEALAGFGNYIKNRTDLKGITGVDLIDNFEQIALRRFEQLKVPSLQPVNGRYAPKIRPTDSIENALSHLHRRKTAAFYTMQE